MTSIPGIINNRKIFYLNIENDLRKLEATKLTNWVLFVIADDINSSIVSPFAKLCIAKNPFYVCAVGKACSEIDDLFDMIMVMKKINGEELLYWMTSSDDVLMTSWHHEFEEGFWFATSAANYEEIRIDTVLVANLTNHDYFPVIEDLTKKIIDGWLPSN